MGDVCMVRRGRLRKHRRRGSPCCMLTRSFTRRSSCESSLFTISRKRYNSIQEHIDADSNKTKKCSHCGNNNSKSYEYNSPPRFRMIGFTANSQDINVSKTLTLSSEAGPVTLPIYESKFILDSFLFWVFPARFLRWLAANVNLLPRSRVCSCDLFGLYTVRFFKWLASIVNLFTWSHDFLLLKLWKGRTSSKCSSCHPAQTVPKSFDIV